MKRRHFLQATTAAAPAGAMAATAAATAAADTNFPWLEASAADLQRAMAEGRTSAVHSPRRR